MQFDTSLFTFHRDLRLDDNRGLLAALEQSRQVLPAFIIDQAFLQVKGNAPHRWRFILESLQDLNADLKEIGSELHIVQGDSKSAIHQLHTAYNFDALFVNEDYTPYHRRRMALLQELTADLQFEVQTLIDYPLVDPRRVTTQKGTPYKVFTYFYNKAKAIPVEQPQGLSETYHEKLTKVHSEELLSIEDIEILAQSSKKCPKGGRDTALQVLKGIGTLDQYQELRDYPALAATSQLSPYIRFGNVSIREVYHIIASLLEDPEPLIQQLYWRDFYTYTGFHFPHVFTSNFNSKYDNLSWENDPALFEKWKSGMTGFPIVDAGIRQLNNTGWMHNRVRMIVASFLVKDLLINWRWGERYFAEQLLDYDPAVNNGSWQWAASTGTDAQPYFRIFNPWRQQQRFDSQAEYIKKWIPELQNIKAKDIHQLFKRRPFELDYPEPVVDHRERSDTAKSMFVP